jgi:hypothetical protein
MENHHYDSLLALVRVGLALVRVGDQRSVVDDPTPEPTPNQREPTLRCACNQRSKKGCCRIHKWMINNLRASVSLCYICSVGTSQQL